MNKLINLLDCTLRDGTHLTKGLWGEKVIKETINDLVQANVDIIEVGFLDNAPHTADETYFSSIADVKRILPKDKKNSHFSLMADFVDVSNIEPCDGTVEFFRLSFKRHRWDWAMNAAEILINKGYKVYINPVNCNVYTDEQYLEGIRKVNQLKPYGFSIVDTFGVLRKQDLSRIYYLVEGNLSPDITIGLHLHENLGLAYSLAQHFLEIRAPQRRVSVDCSILGMGRTPGNLCAEQIMDHLNINYGSEYNTEPALDAGDDYIAPLKKIVPWGYSIPYALSGKFGLHRTYAEYLMGKNRLKTKDIQRILSTVDKEHIEMFDETYIEDLYRQYMSVAYDDSDALGLLKEKITDKSILVICPGSSINKFSEPIKEVAEKKDVIVISVNFVPDAVKPDFVFCANAKRTHNIENIDESIQRILTSNIGNEKRRKNDLIFAYNDCVYFNEIFCEDSTLMLLKVLDRCGCKQVYFAGFDGFKKSENYYAENYTFEQGKNVDFQFVKDVLSNGFQYLCFDFLTPSAYSEENHND